MLNLGMASAAALALAGAGAALWFEPAWRNGRLTKDGRDVMAAIALAVLDGSLPADAARRQHALAAHLDRMDSTLRNLSDPVQREIGDLLALLAVPPGRLALASLGTSWPLASVGQLQSALQFMRSSRLALRQQAYHALRDLTHAAYFADSGTWVQLGYPGPSPFA